MTTTTTTTTTATTTTPVTNTTTTTSATSTTSTTHMTVDANTMTPSQGGEQDDQLLTTMENHTLCEGPSPNKNTSTPGAAAYYQRSKGIQPSDSRSLGLM